MVKGVRQHAKKRIGVLNYKYCHYYVRLEEGEPREVKRNNYESFEKRAEDYIKYLRSRQIHYLP